MYSKQYICSIISFLINSKQTDLGLWLCMQNSSVGARWCNIITGVDSRHGFLPYLLLSRGNYTWTWHLGSSLTSFSSKNTHRGIVYYGKILRAFLKAPLWDGRKRNTKYCKQNVILGNNGFHGFVAACMFHSYNTDKKLLKVSDSTP